MQEEYIKEEEKRGNRDARKRANRLNYFSTPKKDAIIKEIKREEEILKEVILSLNYRDRGQDRRVRRQCRECTRRRN